MKYTCEIEIEKPLDEVVRLFDEPDNLSEWMPGLLSFEHISGEPGRPGAMSKLKFDMNGREMEMVETIAVRDLPGVFRGTYEAPGALNIVKNSFVEIDGGTRWIAENEFRFSSILLKLMGSFMPAAFRKETMKHLKAFKEFAESKE